MFPYSTFGRTSVLYIRMKESCSINWKVLTIRDNILLALFTSQVKKTTKQ